jgi:two-component sensor histidine kinase
LVPDASIVATHPVKTVPVIEARPARLRTLRQMQLFMMLAGIVPFVILGAAAIYWSVGREARRLEEHLLLTARALAIGVDRQFAQSTGIVETLAESPSLRNGNIGEFDQLARAAAKDGQFIGLVDASGRQRFNTVLPSVAQAGLMTDAAKTVRSNAADHVSTTLSGTETLISNSLVGALSKQLLVITSRPVQFGGERMALTLGQPTRWLGTALREIEMPSGWVAAVLDRNNITVARTRAEAEIVGKPATPVVQDLLAHHTSSVIGAFTTADGMPSVVAVARAPRSGYAVAIASPRSQGLAKFVELYGLFSVFGLLLLATALLSSLLISRHIHKAVEGLTTNSGGKSSGIVDIDQVAHRLRDAEARRDLMANELAHRIKNLFSVVSALVSISARGKPEHSDFATELKDRLHVLARTSALASPVGYRQTAGASVQAVIATVVEPYKGDASQQRFFMSGDDIAVNPDMANALALVLHELATNAAKYGSLAHDGRVDISVSVDGMQIKLEWREFGPPTLAPTRHGFGTNLLDLTIKKQLGGQLVREWLQDGLRIQMIIPMELPADETTMT